MNWLEWILTSARFVSLTGSILLAAVFRFYLLISGSTRLEFFPKRLTLILEVAACLGQVAWVCALFWSMDPDIGSGGCEDFGAFFFGTQVGELGCCDVASNIAGRVQRVENLPEYMARRRSAGAMVVD